MATNPPNNGPNQGPQGGQNSGRGGGQPQGQNQPHGGGPNRGPPPGGNPPAGGGPPPNQKDLDLGDALSNGFQGIASVTGAQLVAALSVVGIVNALLIQTLFVQAYERLIEYLRRELDTTDPEIREMIVEMQSQADTMGFGIDIPIPAILVGLLVLALMSEAVMLVAARAFASAELEGISGDLAKRRILPAALSGFVSGILLAIAIGLAVVFTFWLLFIPAIFIAVATMLYRQEIAIADKGPIAAISGSWGLTKGNRLLLFALGIVLVVIWSVPGMVTSFIPGIAGTIANVVVSSAMGIFGIAVVTDAYVQLRNPPGPAPGQQQPPNSNQPYQGP